MPLETTGYNQALLGERPPFRTLLSLAGPGAAATFINGLYSLGDAYFLGKLGPGALAAVTLVFPLLAVLGGVGSAFGSGSSSLISQQFGQRNLQKGISTAFVSIFASVIIGAAVSLIVTSLRMPILRLIGG